MNYLKDTSHFVSEDELEQSDDGKSVNRGLPAKLDLPILLASAESHPRRSKGS